MNTLAWLLTMVLCSPAAWPGADDPSGGPPPAQQVGISWTASQDESGDPDDESDRSGAPAESRRWIGVRLSPLPAPLAAHLGKDGLMIDNVVRDSPADRAGLERYDIVLSFHGRKIATTRELVEAINAAPADQDVPMELIHQGQRRTVHIRPAPRPTASSFDYKYEEETDPAALQNMMRFFGHRLLRDPRGGFLLQPLGPMRDLPEPLRKLLEEGDLPDGLPGIRVFPGPDGFGWQFFLEQDGDGDARTEVIVKRSEDGRTLSIHKHPDGRVEVEREDPQSGKKSTTYDSLDELREKDPEAWQQFHSFQGGVRWMVSPPRPDQLPGLQEQFHRQMRQQLEQMRRQLDEMRRQLRGRTGRPDDEARDTTRDAPLRARSRSADDEQMRISIDDQGHIVVRARRDGRWQTWRFDSKEQFRQQEPQLYEKFKSLLE